MFDGVTTDNLHRAVVKSIADLITANEPDYAKMAARAAMFGIRKEVYGQFEPMHFPLFVKSMVSKGLYDEAILRDYDDYELDVMSEAINHGLDMTYEYAAVKQLEGKYLVQNRVTGELYETPQMANMMISACLFSRYPKDTRMDYVLRFYDHLSTFKISPADTDHGRYAYAYPSVLVLRADLCRRLSGLHQCGGFGDRQVRFPACWHRPERVRHPCDRLYDS